jgi:hypothetical protein
VRLARIDGFTWAQIGRLLRRSRQAVRQRFQHVEGPVPAFVFTPPTVEQRVVSRHNSSTRDIERRREFDNAGPGDLIAW